MFFGLIVLSFVMMYETDFSPSPGDRFLDGIGLKAWSNGNSGLHYTFFLFVLLVTVGYTGTRRFWAAEYPGIANRMPLVIILLLLFTTPVISAANGVVKSRAEGLKAIEYITDGSRADFKSAAGDARVRFNCSIRLKNHGPEELTFYIKYFPNQVIRDEYVAGEYAVATDELGNPRKFTLGPKSETVFNPVFEMQPRHGILGVNGTTRPLSIELFNDREAMEFRCRKDWPRATD